MMVVIHGGCNTFLGVGGVIQKEGYGAKSSVGEGYYPRRLSSTVL